MFTKIILIILTAKFYQNYFVMEEKNKDVSMRLKKVRGALNLSQKEMAEGLSVSPPAYSYIENGINSVTKRVLSLLRHVYKVNPEYIIHGKGDMFIKESSSPLAEKIKTLEAELERSNAIIDALLGKK